MPKADIYTLLALLLICILICERAFPYQALEKSKFWYPRFALLFLAANGVGLLAENTWIPFLKHSAALKLLAPFPDLAQGGLGFVLGSFFFYWWHRWRHEIEWLWNIFHQMHHAPKRIEGFTAFYVHPLESVVSSLLNAALLFSLGASTEGFIWSIFFFSLIGVFYHSNLKTPLWLSYWVNTPELHRIHHLRGKHRNNYSDLPVWDRIFGTFQAPKTHAEQAEYGFRENLETHFFEILTFKNVLRKYPRRQNPKA
ncbi:desaturase [bacterium (Candidatus Blackallbacteria) CG17_big_fil_post_rev_8_21_14_2_50_48_46]|uniref:Desaturase n=1 Tax=bacterium (Candidatus Blackallbacteria) CG17_big_fil_post_rev_8_21_14_2_50_48_46 TaxID=2014261 RepID=A0A2M7FXY4_9BACT|nr:MAG: desaturase [bacterium (Candidatus Blackallbacteria) CG18_big_fil_WC_8_21_14_2_50_49_26]PIW14165.1 MAG: desaturase [bacterium (Candidatus Blackallbacteria) CG17_big_fil_post_rev_8_21_14_2_50_48_46]PIW46706.1 MAG: desaturase [bacterium (Candidatus Blackallbacteria) CG13_big_fil_rev_8_21_14_2_50_49_14]